MINNLSYYLTDYKDSINFERSNVKGNILLFNLDYIYLNLKSCEVKPRNIFKGYVDALYAFRLRFSKANPLNYIAKLLLNSLYGHDSQ